MTPAVAAATPSPGPRSKIVAFECLFCTHRFRRHVRRGLYAVCPKCHEETPGPAIVDRLATRVAAKSTPGPGRARVAVAPARAETPPPAPAPAPARKQRATFTIVGGAPPRTAVVPDEEPPPPASHPVAAPQPAPRRSLLDGLMYG